ncbi:cytochrome P450 71D10-like [Silene latifolia]|uniref:cytochrome P450 71D10-like n=1 Tax=Silene latifolia TaxID=37657 RepID=UPI003D778650
MSRAAFSTKRDEQGPFRALLTGVTETCTGFCAADLFPSIKFLHTLSGMKSKFRKLMKETDRIFEPIIHEHMNNNPDDSVEDLVDVLLKHHKDNVTNSAQFTLTTDNIKGVIMELLGGGSENSSSVVEWAMSELLKNPTKMKKAQAEVREIYKELNGEVNETRFNDLKCLKLVIKETLRLHPPVPLLAPRESMESCKIPPYDIPNKTRVIINAWATGRDPKYWEEPEVFNPERFQDSSIDFKGSHFELLPFGAGRRKCPGISLGIANVELPLAMLLYHFDWKLPHGMVPEELDMDESFGLTMKRKNPLLAIPTISYESHLNY